MYLMKTVQLRFLAVVIASLIFSDVSALFAQQKPQWLPGQVGLNAGILFVTGVHVREYNGQLRRQYIQRFQRNVYPGYWKL
jgi:hypothetical protein